MIPYFEFGSVVIAGKLIPVSVLAIVIATIANFIVAFSETKRVKLIYSITVITILIQYFIGGFLARSLFYLSQTFLHQSMELSQIFHSKIEMISLFVPLKFSSIFLIFIEDPPYPLSKN